MLKRDPGLFLITALFLIAYGFPVSSWGETYYVQRNSGSDSNSGTSPASAWATIAKANSTLVAGDTVIVSPGTYNESISPDGSGSQENYITFAAKPGSRPVVRHVALQQKDYIRVIGFEITHNSTDFAHGVTLYASHHCEILNNYIHHTYRQGIRNNAYYGDSNYNIIRGNVISYTGCPAGVVNQCVGANGINLQGHHNLFEYNEISLTLDFIDTVGGYNIIRNNYFHNFRNSDFPNGSGDAAHVDIWQPFGLAGHLSDRNIFENNWAADNLEANSHFLQVRDETSSGEKEFIIRGNVGVRLGSYIAQFGAIDYVRVYNNTFSDFFHIYEPQQKGWSAIGFNSEHGSDASLNNFVFNNIFYRTTRPDTSHIINIQAGSEAVKSHNACEQAGSDPSCLVTADIRFSDYSDDDFHLQESSSCGAAGRPVTTVASPAGSGVSFTVVDAGFLTDGFGIVEGDSISVGSAAHAKISSIDYAANTITVDTPISWMSGDTVVLAYQESVPAIGAYPVKGDFSYSVEIEQPSKISSEIVRFTAAVTNPENVRFVEFFIDGLPAGRDSIAPFSCDWTVPDPSKTYVVETVAYARFADKQISRSASRSYSYSDSLTVPVQPSNLRVR
jgi:hypothetical protein